MSHITLQSATDIRSVRKGPIIEETEHFGMDIDGNLGSELDNLMNDGIDVEMGRDAEHDIHNISLDLSQQDFKEEKDETTILEGNPDDDFQEHFDPFENVLQESNSLLNNEEPFILEENLEETSLPLRRRSTGSSREERKKKSKFSRKRKVVPLDTILEIDGAEFSNQLKDTSDILVSNTNLYSTSLSTSASDIKSILFKDFRNIRPKLIPDDLGPIIEEEKREEENISRHQDEMIYDNNVLLPDDEINFETPHVSFHNTLENEESFMEQPLHLVSFQQEEDEKEGEQERIGEENPLEDNCESFISTKLKPTNGALSRSTLKTIHILQKKMNEVDSHSLNFDEIAGGAKKKDVAKFFYEILILKSRGFIDLKQEKGFGEILITPQDNLIN
jgi:hypothetical protein